MFWAVTICIAIIILFVLSRSKCKQQSIDFSTYGAQWKQWAAQQYLNEDQRTALATLWAAFEARQPPIEDPFGSLTQDEREQIRELCKMESRMPLMMPKEVAVEIGARVSLSVHLEKMGFRPDHVQPIIGMITSHIGRE